MNARYIGLGFILEFLVKTWLKDRFDVYESELLDKARKIDFVVETEGMDRKNNKIGIQLTTKNENGKLESFLKSKNEILRNVDKAIYVQVDLTINVAEKRAESTLINLFLENVASVIRKEVHGTESLSCYEVSVYDFEKMDLNSNTKTNPEATFPDTEIAQIIRKGGNGKPIIVRRSTGTTHVGIMGEDCVNKAEIFALLNNSHIINNTLELAVPLNVYVRLEKNVQNPLKSDIAQIIALAI